MNIKHVNTIWELKKSGYKPQSIKEEVRRNLIKKLQNKEETFSGIIGYEDTVIPDVGVPCFRATISCSWD